MPIRSILNSSWFFWALLAAPALPMLAALGGDDPRIVHRLLHPTGEFAARFLILCLLVTPLAMLWPRAGWTRWLRARRRWLGVAAFAYAVAHVALYLVDKGWGALAAKELSQFRIWSGWIALIVMAPLAATSWDGAVRALGPRWKPLQRWVYLAALAAFAHWAVMRNGLAPALVHFAPLAGLYVWRLGFRQPRLA